MSFGEGRPEEMLVGIIAGVLAIVSLWRVRAALRDGVVPLYKTRKTREELGSPKFAALVAVHAALAILLAFIAIDLILVLRVR
ncbi:hypothetical protein WJS89_09565 [Sphingomicrobium sp. XHP0235]|uniref:hypothetical protein n=1 Tax=Sphingomicrobium aquimarinum TaxID=3133971 RepID=UPI0031FF3E9C